MLRKLCFPPRKYPRPTLLFHFTNLGWVSLERTDLGTKIWSWNKHYMGPHHWGKAGWHRGFQLERAENAHMFIDPEFIIRFSTGLSFFFLSGNNLLSWNQTMWFNIFSKFISLPFPLAAPGSSTWTNTKVRMTALDGMTEAQGRPTFHGSNCRVLNVKEVLANGSGMSVAH